MRLELTSAIAEGRRLAHEIVARGTHTAPLSLPTRETIPATGRPVDGHLAEIWECDDVQRVTESHYYANCMELLTQLGMTVAPSQER